MKYWILIACLTIAGCARLSAITGFDGGKSDAPAQTAVSEVPVAVKIPEEAAVAAPAAVPTAAGRYQTVAGLGDPSRPGLWLETPLAAESGSARVVLRATGASVTVAVIPFDGPATAGSRLSLDAMRALGAPLTELVELDVLIGS